MNRILYENRCKCNEEFSITKKRKSITRSEGRAPIGRTRPLIPWGKPALGIKTRKRKKLSDAYILRRSS